ncbi:MAG: hypothetical protein Q9170_001419 [Blastenia crenularia]
MTARSVISVPLPRYNALNVTPLLPFLYQTRTIQAASTWSPRTRRSFHTQQIRLNTYGSGEERLDSVSSGEKYSPRIYRNSGAISDPIPFEGDQGNQQLDHSDVHSNEGSLKDGPFTQFAEENSARPPRTSTITATEKAVFDRIFKEIASDNPQEPAQENDSVDDNLDDELAFTGDTYDDLNAIFDEAIEQIKRKSEGSADSRTDEKYLFSLSKNHLTAISSFAGTNAKSPKTTGANKDKDYKAIQKSVAEHRRRVMSMFDDANTDMEIWHVLEAEVFTLIQQYDALRREAEEREKAKEKKPTRKRGRVSKADKEAAAAAKKNQSLRVTKQSIPEAEMQAILSSNYGDYCLTAMRRLRRKFPTSPYCMNLLPNIKRLGSISHVLAASVDIYNEVLFLLWKEYSDLHGMADLIFEMGSLGIESNEVTLKTLLMVRGAKGIAVAQDRPMRLWWTMGPVETGWRRLTAAARGIQREIEQARIRRSVREWEAKDERDTESSSPDREELQGETRTKREISSRGTASDDTLTLLDGGLGVGASQRTEV